jgi:NADPH-dependent ferric siderophore reductase
MSTIHTAKAFVKGVIGRLVFRDATVTRAEALGPHFRRLVLGGPGLGGATWSPGDKLQVFLPGVGTRAYTPVRWDAAAGETELLAYLHGEGPGARWARDARPGEQLQVFGPRSSLVVGGPEPRLVFGDETSLGLALANGANRPAVLEVGDPREMQPVLEALGLSVVTLVERGAHERLVEAVARALSAHPGAQLVLSGRAAAIQAVRQGLRARGVDLGGARAKAYWAPGKVGLD